MVPRLLFLKLFLVLLFTHTCLVFNQLFLTTCASKLDQDYFSKCHPATLSFFGGEFLFLQFQFESLVCAESSRNFAREPLAKMHSFD